MKKATTNTDQSMVPWASKDAVSDMAQRLKDCPTNTSFIGRHIYIHYHLEAK